MSRIEFIAEGVMMPDFNQSVVRQWIEDVIHGFDKAVGEVTYIFCDDNRILDVNRQFLKHDYYTDIITFDYSTRRRLSGDMFISIDTVLSNAQMLGKSYGEELLRVVIHGVLHLAGINDKGPGEREIMEDFENKALSLIDIESVYAEK